MDLKSNEPFWLVKNGIIESYPSLNQDVSCDVLIVGGGITGSLIAHQCIADGYQTVLIDKREIANGSSSATTSMLQYEIDVPLYRLEDMIGGDAAKACYKSCADAIDRLAGLCNEIKSKSGFRQKDSLYFAAFKKDVPALKKEFEARKEAGFEVVWLDQEDIFKRFAIANAYGGILSGQGASVDAFRLVHDILQYNVRRGLEVYDKTELMKVNYHRGYNEVTVNTGSNIKAKRIVYAVGYESAAMIPEKFVNLISTYAIVSEINEKVSRRYRDLLVWNTAAPYIYMRSTDDKRMLIGGEDEEFHSPSRRDRLIWKKEQKLLKSFHKYLPEADFYPDFAWAGTFGETKDGLPYIGVHPAFKKSYFVLGFGGNGITFSVTGMAMVSAWLHDKSHKLDSIFRFGR